MMSLSKILSIAALSTVAVLTPVVATAAAPTSATTTAPVAFAASGKAAPIARSVAAVARTAAAVDHQAAATAGATTAPKAPPVTVVRSGQRLDIGHGAWMTLSPTERCLNDGSDHAVTVCTDVTNGNQAPDSVSLRSSGDRTRTLYSPLYIGSGDAARMTVEAGHRTYQVHVVTLAGHPGYAAGYVWGTPTHQSPTGGPSKVKVTVYDASGGVLARL
ncbi:hypothetical protein [Streptomyces beihaiensis]|uniref:Secreted protein n=1 Tax=Streptomyces beihaiensis TaxID=2984495 RepID=A0ABT3TWW8_9ACTN|nr:hypothetical protein [Streptomyces beihaiensis]MCX3061538.1 hypothetical protein [Streptomyces beihaiensis]